MPPRNEVGARLITSTIDHYATDTPNRTYASIPRSEHLSEGFVAITYKQLANAINHASWWLHSELGERDAAFDTFAYAGPKDLRYPILAVAAAKVGRKVNDAHLKRKCLAHSLFLLVTLRSYFHLLSFPQKRRFTY